MAGASKVWAGFAIIYIVQCCSFFFSKQKYLKTFGCKHFVQEEAPLCIDINQPKD